LSFEIEKLIFPFMNKSQSTRSKKAAEYLYSFSIAF